MRYRLHTLLITVTYAALVCGNWAAVSDTIRAGRVNAAQLLALVTVWGIAMTVIYWPREQRSN
jgi:hypothetical protein